MDLTFPRGRGYGKGVGRSKRALMVQVMEMVRRCTWVEEGKESILGVEQRALRGEYLLDWGGDTRNASVARAVLTRTILKHV